MINKVIILGNVGVDPEIKEFDNGGKIATLKVATSERWKDKSGEFQERTEWHTCVVNRDTTVSFVENYISKGNKVYIEGKIQTRKYTTSEGEERYATEIRVWELKNLSPAKKDDDDIV